MGTVQMGQEGRQEADGTAGGADAGVLRSYTQSIFTGALCACGPVQSFAKSLAAPIGLMLGHASGVSRVLSRSRLGLPASTWQLRAGQSASGSPSAAAALRRVRTLRT